MATTVTDIVGAIETETAAELTGFTQLSYVADVEKNSFGASTSRWGVRYLEASQLPGVTKYMTFIQSFEIVLTKGYGASSISDSAAQSAGLDLWNKHLDLHKRMINNNAGLPGTVIHVTDLAVQEPEFIDESKIAVLRATFNVQYRLSLL